MTDRVGTPHRTAGASDAAQVVRRYHDGTKHHFHVFAQSLGYLDWTSQPRPFRSFADAPVVSLYPNPAAPASAHQPAPIAYDRLFAPQAAALPITAAALGDVLRHALGVSAWKRYRESRWSLRVNPSSGNLHPTEAYLVAGAVPGLSERAGVYHYAPDRHVLERRCVFAAERWRSAAGDPSRALLIALTSIHWREAWKYGERAFRYCQHDLGHAVAALRLAAGLVGWRVMLQPAWSHRAIASLLGIDRDGDYREAEREEPACLLLVTANDSIEPGDGVILNRLALADAVRNGEWLGLASQLSEDHVEWSFIDEVARASEDPGRDVSTVRPSLGPGSTWLEIDATLDRGLDARAVILQRRSALAFDGRSTIGVDRFTRMLARTMPGAHPPWDTLWWTPRIHLAIFVERVAGLEPGLYLLPRDVAAVDRLRAAFAPAFLWESASEVLPLVRLANGDVRRVAQRLSCDQDIAADGFFSLGMIADFDASLDELGPSFYRQLFWESGFVGQVLYLEAEAAGARATGIGCFYDDPVHELLGLEGHAFQSLYHFTVGAPVEDRRLTTEPGYGWEAR